VPAFSYIQSFKN